MAVVATISYPCHAEGENSKVVNAAVAQPWQVLRPWRDAVEKVEFSNKSKDLNTLFDGNLGTGALLTSMEGGVLSIVFKEPREIKNLGIVQFEAADNWSDVKSIAISADGGDPLCVTLAQAPSTPKNLMTGGIQAVRLDKTCKRLNITITETYDGQGKQGWGGLAEIGDIYDPIASKFPAFANMEGIKAVDAQEARQTQTINPWRDSIERIEFSNNSKDLSTLFDGKLGTGALLTKMKGGVLSIVFKELKEIKNLGIVQFEAADNWSNVKSIAISTDGGEPLQVNLAQAPCTFKNPGKGKIQTIFLGKTCKRLDIAITDTYSDGKKDSWGGLAEIGDVVEGAVSYKFTQPLRQKHKSIDLEIESSSEVTADLSFFFLAPGATDSTRNNNHRVSFSAGPLCLLKGRHSYSIKFSDLKSDGNYGIDWNPGHLANLVLKARDDTAVVSISAVKPLPEGAPEDVWYHLPAFTPPTNKSDGVLWTEGMSYSSAGKFANCNYSPILTEFVYGSWFQVCLPYYNGRSWQVFSMQPNNANHGIPYTDSLDVDWVTSTRTRTYSDGNFTKQICGASAPGFLIESTLPLKLRSRGTSNSVARTGAAEEDDKRFGEMPGADGKPLTESFPAKLLTADGDLPLDVRSVRFESLSEPWVLALWNIDSPQTLWGDCYTGVLFSGTSGEIKFDPSGIVLPVGMIGISTSFNGLLGKQIDHEIVRERASLLNRMLRTYPVKCKEWYTVAGDTLRIKDEFSYLHWGAQKWQAADYSPIPPLYSWIADSLGRIKIPWHGGKSFNTATGPYRWTEGNSMEYSIPTIPVKHAAFPLLPGNDETCRLLSEEINSKERADPSEDLSRGQVCYTAFNVIALPSRRMCWNAALQGSSMLTKETRESLLSMGKTAIQQSLLPSRWVPRKELWTGRPYLADGWLDKSVTPVIMGDINSSSACVFYGQYIYSKYSGDWDMAAQNWDKLMDLLRFSEVANDWACPTSSAREGARFSGIDMDTISYVGLCALERMADVLGHKADRDRIAYLRLKTAWTAFARFNIARYFDPKCEHPELFAPTASENCFDLASLTPNKNTSDRPGFFLSTYYSWIGVQPEMYQSINNVFSEKFLTEFQRVFIEKQLPDWRRQPYWIEAAPNFISARAWIKSWPEKDLKNDYAQWIHFIRNDVRREWKWRKDVEGETTPPSWDAGVIAQLQARSSGIYLIDWEPAKLGAFNYNPMNRSLTAEFSTSRPFHVRLHSPAIIKRIFVDGVPSKVQVRDLGNGEYIIAMPPCNKEATIHFAALD